MVAPVVKFLSMILLVILFQVIKIIRKLSVEFSSDAIWLINNSHNKNYIEHGKQTQNASYA